MAGRARGLLAGIPSAVVCMGGGWIAQKHEAPAPLAMPVIGSPSVCFLVFDRKPAHFPQTPPPAALNGRPWLLTTAITIDRCTL